MRNLLFPLDMSYANAGLGRPFARPVAPSHLPHPYRELLVHSDSMTETLENHLRSRLALRLLMAFRRDDFYCRRTLMVTGPTARPIEMGAIWLRLAAFERSLRRQILAEERPLGRLLLQHGMTVRSIPSGFFELIPNSEMLAVFRLQSPRTLYGRQTTLYANEDKVADVVEVLATLPLTRADAPGEPSQMWRTHDDWKEEKQESK